MKQEKSLSDNYCILKILLLSGLLAFALTNELQAEKEMEKSAEQPYAYLFPAKFKKLTQHLQREDIKVSELREDIELDVEIYHIDRIVHDKKQGKERRSFRLGTEHIQARKCAAAGRQEIRTDDLSKITAWRGRHALQPFGNKFYQNRTRIGRLTGNAATINPRRGRPACLPWATTWGCPYDRNIH